MAESKKTDLMMKGELNKEFLVKASTRLVTKLLSKGLKPNWDDRDFIGFISIMSSLHAQTKDWKFPSSDLYITLAPQSLSTLVLYLEEKRKN